MQRRDNVHIQQRKQDIVSMNICNAGNVEKHAREKGKYTYNNYQSQYYDYCLQFMEKVILTLPWQVYKLNWSLFMKREECLLGKW